MAEAVHRLREKNDQVRSVPHNIEVEQALLGAILLNNDSYYRVSDFLDSEHFFDPLHRKIYALTMEMIRSGKIVSSATIKTFLPADGNLGDHTIAQYLVRLAAEATTIINAEDYGRLIYDLSARRSLITIGEDMVNIAYDAPVNVPPIEQIEKVEHRLFELAETGQYDGGFHGFGDAMTSAVNMAAMAYQRDGGLSGIATGLRELDRKMGGLQRSDLIIVAGRPGMGKTSLATNIAYKIAHSYEPEVKMDGSCEAKNGGIIGFFSLEMSSEQLATRIISEQAMISSSDIRRGKITEQQYNELLSLAQKISNVHLYIDQTGGLSIAQLTARARRLKRQRGLDVLVIDYIQLMQGSKKAGENRVQEVTEITTGLKALAKELNIPVIALSQLSRQVENREDKRPQLSDLRESGSIEQDADVVLFVFREEYYVANRKPDESSDKFAGWLEEMEKSLW